MKERWKERKIERKERRKEKEEKKEKKIEEKERNERKKNREEKNERRDGSKVSCIGTERCISVRPVWYGTGTVPTQYASAYRFGTSTQFFFVDIEVNN